MTNPRAAYFDLSCGASGDMILSALAHCGRKLGEPVEDAMREAVAALGLGCQLSFDEASSGGLACLRAVVSGGGRRLTPEQLLDAVSRAPEGVSAPARAGFEALLLAESRGHGTSPDRVHLHEIGTADTAVDLVGASAALAALGNPPVFASPVAVSAGRTETAHGSIPLPAPVLCELLRGVPVQGTGLTGETVTPTAVAILIGHSASFGPVPDMVLQETGLGTGTRHSDGPNVCRVLVGTRQRTTWDRTDVLLETNLDDITPEALGRAVEVLMGAGALDAWVTPVVMKKSRPAFQLSVLCSPSDERHLLGLLFRETPTLGVRRREADRLVLDRRVQQVEIAGQPVRVKVGLLGGQAVTVSPEFDDCSAASGRTGLAFEDIYERARVAVGRTEAGGDGRGVPVPVDEGRSVS
ncbi:MAG TPA: nickel pincer cofactor biosynthesis protein LarC [Actinomycetota bacterium]|nr:nickel pincer cofactor biosynthesis protein LarC [Actinomycetota bacterium]